MDYLQTDCLAEGVTACETLLTGTVRHTSPVTMQAAMSHLSNTVLVKSKTRPTDIRKKWVCIQPGTKLMHSSKKFHFQFSIVSLSSVFLLIIGN